MRPVISWIARAVVATAFIYAGTIKAVHPETFITDIWSYRLLPEGWAYWIAAFLPYLEIAVGLALLVGRQRDGARMLALTLLFVFLVAIVVSWGRGLDIACGCFGTSAGESTNYLWLVVRDLLLIGCLAVDCLASHGISRAVPR